MAPTEGRVARPERRWGCRRVTPSTLKSRPMMCHHPPVYLYRLAVGH